MFSKVLASVAAYFVSLPALCKEIAAAVKEQCGLELDKKKIQIQEPIRTLGVHEVSVKLHRDVTAKLRVQVTEQ